MNLPTFKGVADEDIERFCFVSSEVWNAQNFNTDDVKRAQMGMVFEGRALDWFMAYLTQHIDPIVVQIKDASKQQFRKSKSYSQCMAELKYIKQEPNESVCEVDLQLKHTISEGGFIYDDKKHKEWFISMLLPHLRGPMNQQKIDSQAETLEVAMKLEVASKENYQIQNQLEAMYLDIQSLHRD